MATTSDIRIQRARDGVLAIVGPLATWERMTALHLAVASVLTHQAKQHDVSIDNCLHGFRSCVEVQLRGKDVTPLDPAELATPPLPVERL